MYTISFKQQQLLKASNFYDDFVNPNRAYNVGNIITIQHRGFLICVRENRCD